MHQTSALRKSRRMAGTLSNQSWPPPIHTALVRSFTSRTTSWGWSWSSPRTCVPGRGRQGTTRGFDAPSPLRVVPDQAGREEVLAAKGQAGIALCGGRRRALNKLDAHQFGHLRRPDVVEQGNQADAVVLHHAPQRLVVCGLPLELVRVGHPDHTAVVGLGHAVEKAVDLQPLLVQTENVEGNTPDLEHRDHVDEVLAGFPARSW